MTRKYDEPELVDPPACACRGRAPQMREHTVEWCSVLKSAEIDAALAAEETNPRRLRELWLATTEYKPRAL